MTRDELIEQAAGWVDSYAPGSGVEIMEMLHDEGWRPPPSGDVIDQVARLLADRYDAVEIDDAIEQFSGDAKALADAGLLAKPMERVAELRAAAEALLLLKDGVTAVTGRPSIRRGNGYAPLSAPSVEVTAMSDDARDLLERYATELDLDGETLDEIAPRAFDALRQVLELHVANGIRWDLRGRKICRHCDEAWPCDTAQTVAEALRGEP